MPRKRQIDPGIWTSVQFCNLAPCARLLFIGMISNADDEGRLKGSAQYLKMVVFPGDTYTSKEVSEWRDQVVSQGLARLYNVADSEYIVLPAFAKYQYMTKRFASKLPPPPVNNQLITDTQPIDNVLHGIGIGDGGGGGGGGSSLIVSPNVKETYTKEVGRHQPYPQHMDDGQIIDLWTSVKGCKLKRDDALELLSRIRKEFTDLDILAESKSWAARKLSEPLTSKSKPSAQIWNWMRKAREFAKEKEAKRDRPNIGYRVPKKYTRPEEDV
jgi:hypothetical protein